MIKLTSSEGLALRQGAAKLSAELDVDQAIYLISTNCYLIEQSGAFWLAKTKDVNYLLWTKKLNTKGII
jgi:hypothetical protein